MTSKSTDLVSAQMLDLSEIAPMSAGTRTKLRDLALRVQALEREHRAAFEMGGAMMRHMQRDQKIVATEKRPAFPTMRARDGAHGVVDCYDCDDADPYIDWQSKEIDCLRALLRQTLPYLSDMHGNDVPLLGEVRRALYMKTPHDDTCPALKSIGPEPCSCGADDAGGDRG